MKANDTMKCDKKKAKPYLSVLCQFFSENFTHTTASVSGIPVKRGDSLRQKKKNKEEKKRNRIKEVNFKKVQLSTRLDKNTTLLFAS